MTSIFTLAARRLAGMSPFLMIACLAGVGLVASDLRAQEKPPKVTLFLSQVADDKAPDPATRPQVLRPNVDQEVFVYVKNDEKEEVPVSVHLLVDSQKLSSQPVKAAPGKFTAVPWPRIDMKALKLTELKGQVAFQLTRTVDGKEEALGDKQIILIDRPSNYMTAKLTWVPGEDKRNRLVAVVTAKEEFKGPPAKVELVLLPDRIPGYVPGQKKRGYYEGFVTTRSKSTTLEAESIQLEPGKEKVNGFVYLTVDGYPRAFSFKTTFASSGSNRDPEPLDKAAVSYQAPPLPQPSKSVPVKIEVDDLDRADEDTARVMLELVKRPLPKAKEDDAPAENVSVLAEYRGERDKHLLYAAGGLRGGVLFRPEVKDHKPQVDFSSIFGEVQTRVRLLDAKDMALSFEDRLDEKKAVKQIIRTITLDDSPPESLAWVNAPKEAVRGRSLTLQVTGKDPESGIKQVSFWVGKLTPDKKIPADARILIGTAPKPAKEKDKKGKDKGKAAKEEIKELKVKDVWETTVFVPADQSGLLTVSAEFVNGVGLRDYLTLELPVVNAPVDGKTGGKKEKKKASIAGTVTEGDRPQDGVPVDLFNNMNKVVATAKTSDGGKYLFKELDPGTYRVVSAKSASRTRGQQTVSLAESQEKTGVNIKLYRFRQR